MDNDAAKAYVLEQEPTFLTQANDIMGEHSYVCPACGNGSGNDGTGIIVRKSKTNRRYYRCYKCGLHGDIIELWKISKGITDDREAFESIYAYYGLRVEDKNLDWNDSIEYDGKYKGKQYTHTQLHIHNKSYTTTDTQLSIHNNTNTMTDTQQTDYTEFYNEAHKHINDTDYHRGLSQETLEAYNIGYIANWKNPKSDNGPITPRLIIPTSKYTYLARDTRKEAVKRYSKIKVGNNILFNADILYSSSEPIFIVEGEIDALSIIDVGGKAIGLGSTSNINRLISKLEEKIPEQILVIALDNDEAGQEATAKFKEAADKLKGLKYFTANISGKYKDANEALEADREAFKQTIINTIEIAKNKTEELLEAEREEEEAERQALEREAAAYELDSFFDNIINTDKNEVIPTGFKNIDEILDGGLYAGLYVVGAISSLGKTTFVLQIADQIAKQGKDVIIFSLEMDRDELIAKSLSRITLEKDMKDNHDFTNAKTTRGILTFYRNNYTTTEYQLINAAMKEYQSYAKNIYIVEGVGNLGAAQVRERVERHINVTGRKPIVFIDYFQILAPADIRATDKQNTDKNILELKRISRDYNIPIIGVSSFNRDNYTAPVNLASFKESGAIEYSSDVLIGLQYVGMDYSEGEADKAREKRIRELLKEQIENAKNGKKQEIEIKILKNRNGHRGEAVLDFYPRFNYFNYSEYKEEQDNKFDNWIPINREI